MNFVPPGCNVEILGSSLGIVSFHCFPSDPKGGNLKYTFWKMLVHRLLQSKALMCLLWISVYVYKWNLPPGTHSKSFPWICLAPPTTLKALTLNSIFIFFLHHNIFSLYWCYLNYNSNTHFLNNWILQRSTVGKVITTSRKNTLLILCSSVPPIPKPPGSRLTDSYYYTLPFPLLIQIHIKLNSHIHKNFFSTSTSLF